MTPRYRLLAIATVAVVLAAGLFLSFGRHQSAWSPEAFAAFYCAGETLRQGHDPNLVEPLRACEHRVAPRVLPPGVVEPAPLPGYALAPFVALSLLPYRAAVLLMVLALVLAVALTAVVLADVTGLPVEGTFAALVVVDGYQNIWYGETPPFALAALAVAGYYVAARRDRRAAVAAAIAMIGPHVGVAACVALFVWRPRSRVVLLAAGALLFGLSVLVQGPQGVWNYLTAVLPLHARSETSALDQYSLTWLAHTFGAKDSLATGAGTLSFVALLIFGVALAPRVARRYASPALLVFFPTAATALFGPFIHDIELPAAVPALLAIAGAAGRDGRAAWWAVAIFAVAWLPGWNARHQTMAFTLCAIAALAWCANAGRAVRARSLIAAAAALAYLVLLELFVRIPRVTVGAAPSPWPALATLDATSQASLNWGTYMHAEPAATLSLLLGKIVVWGALATVLLAAVAPRLQLRGAQPQSVADDGN